MIKNGTDTQLDLLPGSWVRFLGKVKMKKTIIFNKVIDSNILIYLVRLAGFEPATYGLEVRCSIQLSYRR